MNRRTRGFSLIEAAIVLAIIGAVIGGIWAATKSVNDRLFEKDFMEGLMVLSQNAQKYLNQQMACGGNNIDNDYPNLYNAVYPSQWLNGKVAGRFGEGSLYIECASNWP